MTLIIADIGVNWDGDLGIVEKMISKSKEAGCNAVKFQAYKKEQVEKHQESSRLEKAAISQDNVGSINDTCEKIRLQFFK